MQSSRSTSSPDSFFLKCASGTPGVAQKGFVFTLDSIIAVALVASALFLLAAFQGNSPPTTLQTTSIAQDAFFSLEETGFMIQTLDSNTMVQSASTIRSALLSYLPKGFDANVIVSSYIFDSGACALAQTFNACFPDSNKLSGSSGTVASGSFATGRKYFLRKQPPGDCNISYAQFSEPESIINWLVPKKNADALFSEAYFAAQDANVIFDVNVMPSSSIVCDGNVTVTLSITVPQSVRKPIDLALVLDRSGSMSWSGRVDTSDARAVFLDGSIYLYVGDGSGGIRSIGISNPLLPSLIGRYDPGTIIDVHGEPGSTHVFILDTSDTDELISINRSNPSNLTESGQVNFDLVVGLYVAGGYAYVAGEAANRADSGLVIMNVSNPGNMAEVRRVDTTNPRGVFVDGNYAYLADGSAGLRVINVTNKATASVVGTYNTAGTAENVFVSGSYAYVADGANGLVIVNVSNPSAPSFVSSYNTPGYAYNVEVAGNYAYVADNTGIQILDVSNPNSISFYKSYATPYTYRDIDVNNGYAYLPAGSIGLITVKLDVGPRINEAKNSAQNFVDFNGWTFPPDQMAVVSFSDSATTNQQLTSTVSIVKTAINSLVASGGTNIGSGISAATTELNSVRHNPNALKFQVLLSDGQSNSGDSATAAQTAAASGIIIFTIGFGADADEAELTNIANITDGNYYFASDENALQAVFALIAKKVGELANDSNVSVPVISGAILVDSGGGTLIDGNLIFDSGSITPDTPWTATYLINFPCSNALVCSADAFSFPGPGTKFNYTDSDGNFHSVDFNSSVTLSFEKRDLAVDITGGEVLGKNDVSLDVLVQNTGDLDADATTMRFYLGSAQGAPLGNYVVPALCSAQTPSCTASSQSYLSVPIPAEGVIYSVINDSNTISECPIGNIDAINCSGGPETQVFVVRYTIWRP